MKEEHHLHRIRAIFSALCGILGILAITYGILLTYSTRALFNSVAFSDRVAASLADPLVATIVANQVTDSLIEQKRDLMAYRPILLNTSRVLVSSDPFRAIVRRAVRLGHTAMMTELGHNVLLTVSDVGMLMRSALANNPELAELIPLETVTSIQISEDSPVTRITYSLIQSAREFRTYSLLFILAGILAISLSLILATQRRRALFRISLGFSLGAAFLFVFSRLGGIVIAQLSRNSDLGPAAVGIWSAFVGGLKSWALVLIGMGCVLMASASALLERIPLEQMGQTFWQWFSTTQEKKTSRFLRAVILLVIGMIAILNPFAILTILIHLMGFFLAFIGLREVFNLILPAITLPESPQKDSYPAKYKPTFRHSLIIGLLILPILATGIIFIVHMSKATPIPRTIDACNGYPELRDRRLNEVVFPTSHNSMAGADIPDWMFPNHEKGIIAQLNDGIRGFLIDIHYGIPIGNRVKTVFEDESAAIRKYEAVLGKEGVAAAMRIRDRLIGGDEKAKGIYLGHGFCELGALPFVPVLKEIRKFLVANPHEVLIIVIQDESVTPQDVAACFQESGLIDFVYFGNVTPPWPTLRQMVAIDQRVLVLAENNSEGVPWYHQAFEVMQETPYSFHDPSQFSSVPNRGSMEGSLFLLNHWIDTPPSPKPSIAEKVNAYDFLLARAKESQKQRGLLPNLIAVDFYLTGNIFDVVNTLNGVNNLSIQMDTQSPE
jgi:hypothetical protein